MGYREGAQHHELNDQSSDAPFIYKDLPRQAKDFQRPLMWTESKNSGSYVETSNYCWAVSL
jgi:hypothetical protein